MSFLKKQMQKTNKIITHNGSYHTDDVFACATLILLFEKKGEKYEVLRTRDESIVASGDYVFDVGGIYDPDNNRFDHHQPGGAGKRENGIEYASFGLVWKKYGLEVSNSEDIAQIIEGKLCQPIDARDNGIDISTQIFKDIRGYSLSDIFNAFRPIWTEENDKSLFDSFMQCVALAKLILMKEIEKSELFIQYEHKVLEAYEKSEDKRIVILEEKSPRDNLVALTKLPEPLFVVYPRSDNVSWSAEAVRENNFSYKNRKNFPEAWAGFKGDELSEVSGVPDALFCHRGLFLVTAKSKEGAIKLAQLSLTN